MRTCMFVSSEINILWYVYCLVKIGKVIAIFTHLFMIAQLYVNVYLFLMSEPVMVKSFQNCSLSLSSKQKTLKWNNVLGSQVTALPILRLKIYVETKINLKLAKY